VSDVLASLVSALLVVFNMHRLVQIDSARCMWMLYLCVCVFNVSDWSVLC